MGLIKMENPFPSLSGKKLEKTKLLEQRHQLAQEELIGSSGIATKSDGDRVVPIGVREE